MALDLAPVPRAPTDEAIAEQTQAWLVHLATKEEMEIWRAHFERMGVASVRLMLNTYHGDLSRAAIGWLEEKSAEEGARDDASEALQTGIDRSARNAAWIAAIAAIIAAIAAIISMYSR